MIGGTRVQVISFPGMKHAGKMGTIIDDKNNGKCGIYSVRLDESKLKVNVFHRNEINAIGGKPT